MEPFDMARVGIAAWAIGWALILTAIRLWNR